MKKLFENIIINQERLLKKKKKKKKIKIKKRKLSIIFRKLHILLHSTFATFLLYYYELKLLLISNKKRILTHLTLFFMYSTKSEIADFSLKI